MCVHTHMCVSVAGQGDVGGFNRKACGKAGSRFVDLASLAAKPRPLERKASLLPAVSTELFRD